MHSPNSVTVHAGRVALIGDLVVPPEAAGIVVFACGGGSGRLSPRNRVVAEALVSRGFATLLFDLLTPKEENAEHSTRHPRFDIPLLADRLVGTLVWVGRQYRLARLPIGLFGASTGAAAALIAAATVRDVATVVSRGGRPDLAGDALAKVRCPTLLIVGGADIDVIELNRRAMKRMSASRSMHIVSNAGHLFEEPGALRDVIDVAAAWFEHHLAAPRREPPMARPEHHSSRGNPDMASGPRRIHPEPPPPPRLPEDPPPSPPIDEPDDARKPPKHEIPSFPPVEPPLPDGEPHPAHNPRGCSIAR